MTVAVHVGEMKTGRITATIPVTGMRWADTLNAAGVVDQVTVTEDVVRDLGLREKTYGKRSFLAVEVDDRIKQAGPIWSRRWDWRTGTLTLGATGLWALFDRRVVRPAVLADPMQKSAFTVTGRSLGGIARALVERATGTPYTSLPIVLPADETGDHTETFPLWKVLRYGDQLRQLTQREVNAPDIRFQSRRTAADPRFIEWVMQVGTEAMPTLSQLGAPWVFDASAPQTPVLGISTEEDATVMAEQVWLTGNGMEENILMTARSDSRLLDLGWPQTDASDSHSTVEQQSVLDGHADDQLRKGARPVELFRVSVRADAAGEALAGDYSRLITKGDAWLGDMNLDMRLRQVSGDLGDSLDLEMFKMAAAL